MWSMLVTVVLKLEFLNSYLSNEIPTINIVFIILFGMGMRDLKVFFLSLRGSLRENFGKRYFIKLLIL